jgi:hypothetical protein
MIRWVLKDLRRQGFLECLGRGRNAKWNKIRNEVITVDIANILGNRRLERSSLVCECLARTIRNGQKRPGNENQQTDRLAGK